MTTIEASSNRTGKVHPMGTWHTIRWRTIAVGAELARPRCNNPESITGSGGLRFAQRIHCGNCRVACQAWFIRVQQGGGDPDQPLRSDVASPSQGSSMLGPMHVSSCRVIPGAVPASVYGQTKKKAPGGGIRGAFAYLGEVVVIFCRLVGPTCQLVRLTWLLRFTRICCQAA